MIALRDDPFYRLAAFAREEIGLHLKESKRVFVSSRLQRRLHETGLHDFEAYADLIEGGDAAAARERDHLVSALTTNVTGIFREPHHFKLAAEHLRSLPPTGAIRIWSAGCSTGEEALSLAATCRAVVGPRWRDRCRILATDIDGAALSRTGAMAASPTCQRELADGLAGIGASAPATLPLPELMGGISFMQHNLLTPLPTEAAFDLVFCRNVTIYFAPAVQRAVQLHLVARLAETGVLCLGHSERMTASDLRLVGPTSYARVAAPMPMGSSWH